MDKQIVKNQMRVLFSNLRKLWPYAQRLHFRHFRDDSMQFTPIQELGQGVEDLLLGKKVVVKGIFPPPLPPLDTNLKVYCRF